MAENYQHQAPLPVESFIPNFTASLGAYKGIDLRQLCNCNPAVKGQAWQKSYRPKLAYDSAKGVWLEQLPKTLKKGEYITRRVWEADPDLQTQENFFARRTPHQDVDFYMSAVNPVITETGHEFETLDKVTEADDPSSEVMKTLVDAFQLDRNIKVLQGVLAPKVTRKKLDLTKGSSTFGTVVTADETWGTGYSQYNTYETQETFFSLKNDAPRIRAMADSCNVSDKDELVVLINPHDAGDMCVKSFNEMYSIDFVEKKHLASGSLPEAFGISFVKCNLMPKGEMVAWVKNAVSWTVWQDLEIGLDRNISNRNRPEFYAREVNNIVRVDDMGVFKINIKKSA